METVADMHDEGIASFMRLQGRFHPLETIWDIYSGLQELNFAYTLQHDKANVTEFHAIFEGLYFGNITSPRVESFSSDQIETFFLTYKYTAILPQLTYYDYDFEKKERSDIIELVINIEYNTDICQEITIKDSWNEEQEIYCTKNYNAVSLDQQKCSGSYPVECSDEQCSFSLSIECDIGNQGIDEGSAFQMSWYLTSFEGEKITGQIDEDLDQTDETFENYDAEEERKKREIILGINPLIRWFNMMHHFTGEANMSIEYLWKTVIDVKTNRTWKNEEIECQEGDEEDDSPEQERGNLSHDDIESILNDIDQERVTSSESRLLQEDLTEAAWISGFEMFCYIDYCPKTSMQTWTMSSFYAKTLALAPARRILETLTTIINQKASDEVDFSPELSLYNKLNAEMTFKSGIAVMGLSSKQKILSDLDSPFFVQFKDPLKICLETGSCDEVEELVTSLSSTDYSWANHPVHVLWGDGRKNPSAFIPFCALGGDMEVLGRKANNFSFPVCNIFSPRSGRFP